MLQHTQRNQIGIFSIRRLLLSWLLAVTIEYWMLPGGLRSLADLNGLAQMSLSRILLIGCGGTILLTGLSRLGNTTAFERWSLTRIFCALAISALCSSFSWPFLGVCLLMAVGLIDFGIHGWDNSPEPKVGPRESRKAHLRITIGLSIAFFLFVCAWTVGRVYSFSTPSFDFGIFSQMFYRMKESGLPITTIERDGTLSHFAVHVSPICYLLLPFYWLVPTPATLQVLQAAVVTSSVIPLWKIGKHHGLSGAQRMLICGVLLLYPAFSGGTSYDLHENCFLTPLLLWLFYGIDRKNPGITAISALLTLMVKEDAAVYVAVIALWLILRSILRFQKKHAGDLITGIAMLAAALIWFFLATGYLAGIGDGVMTYRYDNFLYDGSSSLITVIRSVILNPMKAVYECADAEKLWFIAMTLLPLLGLPLLTRRYERYILLIPYILVNLMSDYPYQHNIFFQYTFGSIACLVYLTVINLADWKTDRLRLSALILAAAVTTVSFCAVVIPKAVAYPVRCIQNWESYQEVRDELSKIPEEASVTATTFYTTFLSQRETLYDVRYSSQEHMLETQYIVLDISAGNNFAKYADSGKENGFENLVKLLEENGYERITAIDDTLVIYRRNE